MTSTQATHVFVLGLQKGVGPAPQFISPRHATQIPPLQYGVGGPHCPSFVHEAVPEVASAYPLELTCQLPLDEPLELLDEVSYRIAPLELPDELPLDELLVGEPTVHGAPEDDDPEEEDPEEEETAPPSRCKSLVTDCPPHPSSIATAMEREMRLMFERTEMIVRPWGTLQQSPSPRLRRGKRLFPAMEVRHPGPKDGSVCRALYNGAEAATRFTASA
jgi:hypothetical protein